MSAPQPIGPDAALVQALQQLSADFAWFVDHGQAERAAGLFTPTATLTSQGVTVTGAQALKERLAARQSRTELVSRHVVSNLRLAWRGADVAGSLIMVVYRGTGQARATLPAVVADVDDIYTLCDDGRWRIQARNIVAVFAQAAPSPP